jgi:hypothetical protein
MNLLGLFHLYSLLDFMSEIRDIGNKNGVARWFRHKKAQSVRFWAMEEGSRFLFNS